VLGILKRLVIGKPIASSEEHHQRLRKLIALPVFASDAVSSTAYATDEILVVLLLQAHAGNTAWGPIIPIALRNFSLSTARSNGIKGRNFQ